jgi:SH3-like domain-containing protein
MSLRFDDVNLRVGPGLRYPIDWVYHRRDLPVEVIRELDDWRLVQDQDNIRGWVRAPALSPRRGFVVRTAESTLRAKPTDDSSAVALLKPGVVGHVRKCDDGQVWCEIDVGSYRGYLRRDQIYGVYPTEAVGG